MQKQKIFFYWVFLLGVFTIVSLILFLCYSCRNNNQDIENKDAVNFRDFYMSAESIGLSTTAEGTILLKGNHDNPNQVLIIGWIEIDSRDFGGVSFGIPNDWKVNGITSSYPYGTPVPQNEHYSVVNTINHTLSQPFQTFVEVGSLHSKTGGGKGSVMIELEPSSQKRLDNLEIQISVGSQTNDKQEKIMYPLWEVFKVPYSAVNIDQQK
jgi:hypothetical protein